MKKSKTMEEPKALKEIHYIRGHLSKLSKDEIDKRLENIRRRYKRFIVQDKYINKGDSLKEIGSITEKLSKEEILHGTRKARNS